MNMAAMRVISPMNIRGGNNFPVVGVWGRMTSTPTAACTLAPAILRLPRMDPRIIVIPPSMSPTPKSLNPGSQVNMAWTVPKFSWFGLASRTILASPKNSPMLMPLMIPMMNEMTIIMKPMGTRMRHILVAMAWMAVISVAFSVPAITASRFLTGMVTVFIPSVVIVDRYSVPLLGRLLFDAEDYGQRDFHRLGPQF